MNQKIKCLIDGGFISIADVLEYAQHYMDGVDLYDDEQLNRYSSLEYVVVSTSYKLRETMIFPANENGEITHWGDLACVREGAYEWDKHNVVIQMLDNHYTMVKVVEGIDEKIVHTLWKKS